MTALRWILLVAGLVVMAAIYLVGRRKRRTSASDASLTMHDSFVPQLDQPIRMRERTVDPPLTITAREHESDGEIADELPPMHARDSFTKTNSYADALPKTSAHTPMSTSYQPIFNEPQTTGMTTGAFIAAQAREPVTRKLYEQGTEQALDQKAATPNPTAQPIGKRDDVASSVTNSEQTQQTVSRAAKKPATRKIVALRLAAGSERVEGARLKTLLEGAGLRHGKYGIYHCMHDDESPLFSVASMVEPGTFDVQAMQGTQFPGVTIFTQLPGPIEGTAMFAQMLACARELEQGIGGLLQDERGLPLTEQRAQRLRDEVADFAHLLGRS